ncbi:MFS transporter [Cellvibrio japonicus]|uniref:Putative Macrolide-efflux protein n=1 Tax=Cellvibrio japonicus (strain Ueda107) TaxID=498211 RepID=B3PDZ2_CELJU|nr:MFS transporter [Cellvibrio japonicus]ACE84425.1 putative Macrolide-efflux protein [Cellvibrio japonicus Ueda107]QEI13477.1 MFS transporter [Cellvibrio japonicus]QEI17051.1 MFS transporter [Cellvibrio japonicus]QEI20629.1 MFS transporter [Cellvibrio japonicus]
MSMRLIKDNRNFQIHWVSSLIAQMGNFFTVVAMPWLALSISNNDPVSMATVLAAASLPQAVFLLFGGLIVDRFSPFGVLFSSRIIFVLVVMSLAVLVYFNQVSLYLLHIYSFLLGTLTALSIPAAQSMLPGMTHPDDLGHANGYMMGSIQVAQILGPLAAGWVIWMAKYYRGIPESHTDSVAIAIAFFIDALGVLIAVILMSFIRLNTILANKDGIFHMLKEGFVFCWRDKGVAVVLGYLFVLSFFLHGTLMAGLPVVAKLQLGLDERGYSVLYAMLGIGTVLGIVLGMLIKLPSVKLGLLVICCDITGAWGLIFLSTATSYMYAAVALVVIGIPNGFVMVSGTTWFQKRTPAHLMGRVISILMFSILGLVPVSLVITGWLMTSYPATAVLQIAGLTILLLGLVSLSIPGMRRIGATPVVKYPFEVT